MHWVGEGVDTGPQWVGEGWLIWICHRAAIERFEPHRCTRQRQTVLRSTKSTTSIEKSITMDPNGFFNVHRSRASRESTETLVDCVNEGAGYNNSLRLRRTLLTSASQASGSIHARSALQSRWIGSQMWCVCRCPDEGCHKFLWSRKSIICSSPVGKGSLWVS